MSLADLRRDYSLSGLSEKDLARDPFRQFEHWFQEAEAAKIPEPNAMICSLASRSGAPSSRTVLLKGLDGRGFVFFSNYESRKGRELAENPRASQGRHGRLHDRLRFRRKLTGASTVDRLAP